MITGTEPEALLTQITDDAHLLVAAAERAGWDAPVPGLEWDVRTVVTHTGAVLRWAADIVRRAMATTDVPTGTRADAVVTGSSDALYRWAWNRPRSGAVESGDRGTLESWRTVRIA